MPLAELAGRAISKLRRRKHDSENQEDLDRADGRSACVLLRRRHGFWYDRMFGRCRALSEQRPG